jgi:3-hydroxyisobutyrate dehydrogenase
VGLALTAAHTYDLPTPLTWAAKSVYEAVCQEDGGEMATKDFRSVPPRSGAISS